MYTFTQNVLGHSFYYKIYNRCCVLNNQTERDSLVVAQMLLVLSITTGIKLSWIFKMRWNELIQYSNIGEPIARKSILFNNQRIPLTTKVTSKIIHCYIHIGMPPLENSPHSSLESDSWQDYSTPEKLLKGLVFWSYFKNYPNWVDDSSFDYDSYSQVLFAHRVLTVYGYTNSISKQLKHHFNFALNKDLFSFLSLEKDIKTMFQLKNIQLDKGELFLFNDKDFSQGYNFQNFGVFVNQLINANRSSKNKKSNSIRILLLLSIYTGLKPSLLLNLKWEDIYAIDEQNKTMKPNGSFKIQNHEYFLERIIIPLLNYHCPYYPKNVVRPYVNDRTCNEVLYLKMAYSKHKNDYVFILSNGNKIPQQSLSREIKIGLKNIDFPYWNSVTTTSTQIMYGRRILEIMGDHKPSIRELKKKLNCTTTKDLFELLHVLRAKNEISLFKGKRRESIFEIANYDL